MLGRFFVTLALLTAPLNAAAQEGRAAGIIRIRSDIPFYKITIREYDGDARAVVADGVHVTLRRDRWFFTSRTPKTFTLSVPPGLYVMERATAYYGARPITLETCFSHTVVFEQRSDVLTDVGEYVLSSADRSEVTIVPMDAEDATGEGRMETITPACDSTIIVWSY